MLLILTGTTKACAPVPPTATVPSKSRVSKWERSPVRSAGAAIVFTLLPVGLVYGGFRKKARPWMALLSVALPFHHRMN